MRGSRFAAIIYEVSASAKERPSTANGDDLTFRFERMGSRIDFVPCIEELQKGTSGEQYPYSVRIESDCMVFGLQCFEIIFADFCNGGSFCWHWFGIRRSDSCVTNEQIHMSGLRGDLVNGMLELDLRGHVADDGVDV